LPRFMLVLVVCFLVTLLLLGLRSCGREVEASNGVLIGDGIYRLIDYDNGNIIYYSTSHLRPICVAAKQGPAFE